MMAATIGSVCDDRFLNYSPVWNGRCIGTNQAKCTWGFRRCSWSPWVTPGGSSDLGAGELAPSDPLFSTANFPAWQVRGARRSDRLSHASRRLKKSKIACYIPTMLQARRKRFYGLAVTDGSIGSSLGSWGTSRDPLDCVETPYACGERLCGGSGSEPVYELPVDEAGSDRSFVLPVPGEIDDHESRNGNVSARSVGR